MCVTNRVGEIKAMNDNDFKAFINDESWEEHNFAAKDVTYELSGSNDGKGT